MNKSKYTYIICASSIFISYFYYGILQEKVTKGKYEYKVTDNDGDREVVQERFHYPFSLVFIMCLVNYLFSKAYVIYKNEVEDKTHNLTFYYCGVSLTYLLGMVTSTMALQWVNFPTQVVGKSAKPIPVILLGALVAKKSYPFRKYIFVLLIVIGVVMFMYKDQRKVELTQDTKLGFGELLVLLSLTMDGLTGAIQEKLRALAKPTGEQMMVNTNFWSCIYLIVFLIISGEVVEFLAFTTRHPYVLVNICIAAVVQAIGQHFIYIMVSNFGPLPVSIVTTIRKFVTVLFSVVFFGNTLIARQWFGAIIVFTGLFLDAVYSKKGSPSPTPQKDM